MAVRMVFILDFPKWPRISARANRKGSFGEISRASKLVQQAAEFVAKTNLELSENIPVRGKKEENLE